MNKDRNIGAQVYGYLGTVPYTNLSGREVTVDAWWTCCPDCGSEFVVKTSPRGKSGKQGPAIRRCEAHRAPGRRVPP